MDNNETKTTKSNSTGSSTRRASSSSSSTSTRKSTSSTGATNSTTRRAGGATGVTGTTATPLSAEEKLKKSMKGLSHMGGVGGGGLNLDTGAGLSVDDKAVRKKVGGVVLDMETIQDANKQKLQTSNKRRNVVILVLSLLLVISLVYLVVAIIGYINSKKPANCFYNVEGEATWLIEGEKKTEFRTPSGIGRDKIYVLLSALKIETTDSVELVVIVDARCDGEEVLIAGLYEINDNLVRVDGTNKFVYQLTITGGDTIQLFSGIDFKDAPYKLTDNNLKITVTAYVTRV